MCGIISVYDSGLTEDKLREILLKLTVLLRHRGPDWSGIAISTDKKHGFAHERLSIVDPNGESQPFINGGNILTVNGEIYNHRNLREELNLNADYDFSTGSDCEVIIPLSKKKSKPEEWLNEIDGQFAFAMLRENEDFIVARDPIGIAPLYYLKEKKGGTWYASEMKVLTELTKIINVSEESVINIFPPGHYSLNGGEPIMYFFRDWFSKNKNDEKKNMNILREKLEKSVVSRLMTDVPFGVLLSGGLDSSIIAHLVCNNSKKRIETDGRTESHWSKIHTFSIGVEGENSPDLINAKKVAEHLGTIHHEFTFSIEDGINSISEVIRKIETYDTTTIRASTPMFLLSRKIKAMGIKMVLSGEGADELFGGYLYFHKAPNQKEFQEELIRKVSKLHHYDCMRANKSTMAWGVEVRVPFLGVDFVDFALSIDPKQKMIGKERMEKYILRKSFEDSLPESIVWRQKEQFSDGVGYSWIDQLKAVANNIVKDLEMKNAKEKYPENTPRTKEEMMYRNIFEEIFGNKNGVESTISWEKSVACSTSKASEWDEGWVDKEDPSGRLEGIHH